MRLRLISAVLPLLVFHYANAQRVADHSASWSPDGKKLVFNSNRGGSYEIYTVDHGGANEKQLTGLNK